MYVSTHPAIHPSSSAPNAWVESNVTPHTQKSPFVQRVGFFIHVWGMYRSGTLPLIRASPTRACMRTSCRAPCMVSRLYLLSLHECVVELWIQECIRNLNYPSVNLHTNESSRSYIPSPKPCLDSVTETRYIRVLCR